MPRRSATRTGRTRTRRTRWASASPQRRSSASRDVSAPGGRAADAAPRRVASPSGAGIHARGVIGMTPLLAQRSRTDRAFERLYRRHVGDVYRYALAVLRSPADAEDVTQTTFLNAYRAYQKGETPESPHNWFIAIAHNVCRQRFRQSARRPREVELDTDVADNVVDDD